MPACTPDSILGGSLISAAALKVPLTCGKTLLLFDSVSPRGEVRSFFAWRPLAVDDEMLEAAWALQDRHSLSFWDALILGAAQASGCQRVLSEDFSDGEIYGGVEVVNPFTQRPG